MRKIKNENFITIQGWMVNELNLKGNDLIIYAIIYGFSQEENQTFKGGLQYLADWTSSTKRGVLKNIKKLVEKGLIEKKTFAINGVNFCEYRGTQFYRGMELSSTGVWNSVPQGMELSSTNNIIDNIKDNIKENITKETYVSVVSDYTHNEELISSLKNFVEMRKKMKGFTVQALRLSLNKLDKLACNDDTKIAIVNQSIENSWKTFYPLKEKTEQKGEKGDNWSFLDF